MNSSIVNVPPFSIEHTETFDTTFLCCLGDPNVFLAKSA
jgi:hypothetical protein